MDLEDCEGHEILNEESRDEDQAISLSLVNDIIMVELFH